MTGLTLADELALLALDDRGAKQMGHPAFDYGLGGALLVELALTGRVVVEDNRVAVADPSPLGAPLLDEALARISDERRRKPKDWVSRLAKRLPGRVLDELVGAGVRTRESSTVLLVFDRTRYPVPGGRPAPAESELRTRLDTAIRSYAPLEPRTAALLAL